MSERTYLVLAEDSREELSVAVTDALMHGVELVGGVAMTCYTYEDRDGYKRTEFRYAQAVLMSEAPHDPA